MTLDADIARAVGLHEAGQLDEAEAAYRAIIAVAPDRSGVIHNLGVVLAQAGRPAEAIGQFDRALDLRPDYSAALVNKGGALETLGRDEEAAVAYEQALALRPDHYPAHVRRALVLLGLGWRAAAMDHFRKTRALRRDPAFMGRDHPSFTRTSRHKIAHDAAQFRYLAARGIAAGRFADLAALYDSAIAGIDWPDDAGAAIDLEPAWRERLAASYNRVIDEADILEIAGGALNPHLDGAAIARAYDEATPSVAVIDNLLTSAALDAFRRHLMDSTIWHDFSHIGGFLAAYLEDGLACPPLLQMADELRTLLPEILGPHRLRQAWAFKCVTGDKGIDAHADDGAVSVNFWVTPDIANLEPDSGGLIVHLAEPPAEWTLADYDRDIGSIRRFLAESEAATLAVPYRQNRAVLFRSGLFHESGAVRFGEGYDNHRINVTLLFGDPPDGSRMAM